MLGSGASTQHRTVILEERMYVIDGVQCRYQLVQTTTQGGGSTGEINANLVLRHNADGVVCANRPDSVVTGEAEASVTISGSTLPDAKFVLRAGLNEGTRSRTIDISVPGEQTGEHVVTLYWFLSPP